MCENQPITLSYKQHDKILFDNISLPCYIKNIKFLKEVRHEEKSVSIISR